MDPFLYKFFLYLPGKICESSSRHLEDFHPSLDEKSNKSINATERKRKTPFALQKGQN